MAAWCHVLLGLIETRTEKGLEGLGSMWAVNDPDKHHFNEMGRHRPIRTHRREGEG